ncbi:MAG: hypothetical protein II680_08125, partial [Clostridia bacterium]|nr:hypothetical protein [Clostridia bacterium]
MFRFAMSESEEARGDRLYSQADQPRVPSIPAKRSHTKTANPPPHPIPPQINRTTYSPKKNLFVFSSVLLTDFAVFWIIEAMFS